MQSSGCSSRPHTLPTAKLADPSRLRSVEGRHARTRRSRHVLHSYFDGPGAPDCHVSLTCLDLDTASYRPDIGSLGRSSLRLDTEIIPDSLLDLHAHPLSHLWVSTQVL